MRLDEILEQAPLYVWKSGEFGKGVPKITAYCDVCKSPRSFSESRSAWAESNRAAPIQGNMVVILMVCSHCERFHRAYILRFHDTDKKVMKAGQYPPWDLGIDAPMARLLGEHEGVFRKGFVCESQGYGIASFAYYRRIVENVIDKLLESIEDLIEDKEKAAYTTALEQVKTTRQTSEKIALVKDLLPSTLRPGGINPLGVLHGHLSEGLHQDDDDSCLSRSTSIRTILTFLVNQVQNTKDTANEFTEAMRKLLDKKA